jgi:GNAT superfamily N-acetyltransferase
MGHEDTRKNLEGSVFWDRELTPLKLPTARILHHDLAAEFPYTILEHIKGADLGRLFSSLTPNVRRQIAHSLAEIQSRVAALPRAQGFGYGFSFSDPRLRESWRAILDEQLDRARQWIRSVGVASESHVERVSRELTKIRGYLDDVVPTPFLHDTTTKNVLVTEGGLALLSRWSAFHQVIDPECFLTNEDIMDVMSDQLQDDSSGSSEVLQRKIHAKIRELYAGREVRL